MANSKATESELSKLHGNIAKVLDAQISHQEEETSFDADGNVVNSGELVYTVSPATISAAIKFLKDNSCTADIKTDKNLGALHKTLEGKQKHSRVSATRPSAVEAARKLREANE